MAILDENDLLTEDERAAYLDLLRLHGHESHHFVLEVEEDQDTMDMNDLNYVIIVKVKATHVGHEKSKIYRSEAGAGTWLEEFEQDLKGGYFASGEESPL
ncbi:MAG: hypothetical protein JSR85_01385 [Proteobacteria bacterium]|nr:hypothetical protein [Pseudomonadota bacterium]